MSGESFIDESRCLTTFPHCFEFERLPPCHPARDMFRLRTTLSSHFKRSPTFQLCSTFPPLLFGCFWRPPSFSVCWLTYRCVCVCVCELGSPYVTVCHGSHSSWAVTNDSSPKARQRNKAIYLFVCVCVCVCRLCVCVSAHVHASKWMCNEKGVDIWIWTFPMVLWGWGPAAVGTELVILHPVIKGPVLSKLPYHPLAVPLIFPSLPSPRWSSQSPEQPCVSYNPLAVLLIIHESCTSYWSRPTGNPSLGWLLPLQTQLPPLMVKLYALAAPRLKQSLSVLDFLETFRQLQCCYLLPSSPVFSLLNSFELHTWSTLSRPWRSLS